MTFNAELEFDVAAKKQARKTRTKKAPRRDKLKQGSESINTISQLAEQFAVSRMTIYRWIKDGMPVNDGSYNISEVQQWLLSRKGSGDEKPAEAKTWEGRYRKAKALKEELSLKLALKEVVAVKKVEAELVHITGVIKSTMLGIPNSLAPILVGKSVEEVAVALRSAINDAILSIRDGKAFAKQIMSKLSPEEGGRASAPGGKD